MCDVAMLYHYETKKINQTVKRNIQRFPERFCFQINENELKNLRSQIVTASNVKELYHCGASLKDLGKKCFAISKMKDTKLTEIVENIVKIC